MTDCIAGFARSEAARTGRRWRTRAMTLSQSPGRVRREGEHRPYWPAERAGEMDHRGVDRDDQVKIGNRGGGLGKIGKAARQIDDLSGGEPCQITGVLADL